jgi:excisionase family DNA binding protein
MPAVPRSTIPIRPITPPLAYSVVRARELTGLSDSTLRALLRDGRLRAVRIGGLRRTLIHGESLRELIAQATRTQPEATA